MRNQVKRLLEVIHQFRLAPDMPLSAGDAPLLAASGMPAAAALGVEEAAGHNWPIRPDRLGVARFQRSRGQRSQ